VWWSAADADVREIAAFDTVYRAGLPGGAYPSHRYSGERMGEGLAQWTRWVERS
jgi:hypothetical protein